MMKLVSHRRMALLSPKIFAPVYDRFTEGFGTTDLHVARVMLDTLPA
jgi:hypothetical protein